MKQPPSGPPVSSDWQRVEELYDICERWKAPAALLPSVLQRLKLLKGIHQEAGGVAVRLSGEWSTWVVATLRVFVCKNELQGNLS